MKIQPVIEHEPADKWVEGKSQSTDEVGKEHDYLVGSWSQVDLPCVWKPVRDVCCPELRNVPLLAEEAIYLPPAPDMFGCAEKGRTGALELEHARIDERRRKEAWVKEENPYLFIKAVETVRLPTCPLKSLISQAPRLMARLGYPYPY